MTDQETCDHVWTSNSGQGGVPVYNINMPPRVMHAWCLKCDTRSFFTCENWKALPRDKRSMSGRKQG